MNSKISSSWSLFVIGFVVIVCSSTVAVSVFSAEKPSSLYGASNSAIEFIQNVSNLKTPTAGIPVHLTIPDIKVDALVESTGLTALGAVGVPKGPVDVAWYDLGARPGDVGSAVIVGHEGWKDGIAAVFDSLSKLRAGDKVYVKDSTGTTTTFIVRQVKMYGENESAPAVFFSNDGLAHLNLITCEGIWNAATKSYSNRLVVFTDKEYE